MRHRRIERGALTLAYVEVKFQIDTETHDPLDIGMYQIREANQMIEEFMLAANVSVAGKNLKAFSFVLDIKLNVHKSSVTAYLCRRHPSPMKEMLEPLLRIAAAVGLDLDVSSLKTLADSLDRVVAVYLCSGDLTPSEFHHYGLASPLYTHFTSHIRRYPDVIVHRLLAAALEIYKLPPIFQDRPQLTSISDSIEMPKWLVGPQLSCIHSFTLGKAVFSCRPTDIEARIVKIRANGFIVFVPKYGIEGHMYLTPRGEKGGDWFVDEEHQKVKKMDRSISYRWLEFTWRLWNPQLAIEVGASTKDAPQVESSVAKRGDILIDINDRFPRDFLSDIFSKKRLTEESSSISPLYNDGTGLSINIGHSFIS
ncbi:hypothetical protein IFM89_018814 [Coptis chinensis]|uniref:RNB domain-containing protein n=1 Tax=Coptis chinensis TaxID=261450 RepID=A0A835H024_9MAGN|nr:hypothetical protein IFM89_018814 [Coptis chinensis]